MKLFTKKEEKSLVVKEQPVIVAVPDIKEYLVKEYERVEKLRKKAECLESELEESKELKFKYDATLVTLDEYRKRLEYSEKLIEREKEKVRQAQKETSDIKDELNSYKIILRDAALTKEAITEEIICEFKSNLIENFNAVKGNLSKSIVAQIINETGLCPTKKDGAE